ncbi:MAG: methyltransferase, partial [Myxococcales bacterium]|nr:methyltransferase [Myxococcales bacterium]
MAAAQIRPGMRVLEPSAGSGSIAAVIREQHPDATLHLLEVNATLREILKDDGFDVAGRDFTAYSSDAPYDRIIMNPPFENRQDVEHISRALGMLAPGGRLVAIAAAGLESRSDAKTAALRERLAELGGTIETLPAGSFKDAGTNVNTVIVVVSKPGAAKVKPKLAVVREPAPAPAPAVAAVEKQPDPKPAPVRRPEPAARRPEPVPEKSGDETNSDDLRRSWDERVSLELRRDLPQEWTQIPNQTCWNRGDGEILATLCVSILDKPAGDCQPSQAGVRNPKARGLMLCEPGEDPLYFPRGADGAVMARHEVDNLVMRKRVKRAKSPEHAPTMPLDPLNPDAVARYVDTLVPTRWVYAPDKPYELQQVRLLPPAVVTRDGNSTSLLAWEGPIPGDATVIPQISAKGPSLPLPEFERKLRARELVVYAGLVSPITAGKVLGLVPTDERATMAKRGITMDNVQGGRFGNHQVYWLTDYDGGKTYGPVTAWGKPVTKPAILNHFAALHADGKLPMVEPPEGWVAADTIMIAALVDDRRLWFAWNQTTHETSRRVEGGDWEEPRVHDGALNWDPSAESFNDLASLLLFSVERQSYERHAKYRVTGPWLGVLYPSDLDKPAEFDPPTGGELDVDRLESERDFLLQLSLEHPDADNVKTIKKAIGRRVKWAKQWGKPKRGAEALRAAEKEIEAADWTLRAAEQAARKADWALRSAAPSMREAKERAARKAWQTTEQAAERLLLARQQLEELRSGEATSRRKTARPVAPKPENPERSPAAHVPEPAPPAEQEEPIMSKTSTRKSKKTADASKASKKKAAKAKADKPKAAAKAKTAAKAKADKPKKPRASKPDKPKAAKAKADKPKKPRASKPKPDKPRASKPKAESPPISATATTEPGTDVDKLTRAWRSRLRRNDHVRFRSNSRIAAGLGIDANRKFRVLRVVTHEGQSYAVLDLGLTRPEQAPAIPVGHLAVVER